MDISSRCSEGPAVHRLAQTFLLLHLGRQHSDLRRILQVPGMPVRISVIGTVRIHVVPVAVRPSALGSRCLAVHHRHVVTLFRFGVVAHRRFLHTDPADLVLIPHFSSVPGLSGQILRFISVVDVKLAAQLQTNAHLSRLSLHRLAHLVFRFDHPACDLHGMAVFLIEDLVRPVVRLMGCLWIESLLVPCPFVGVNHLPYVAFRPICRLGINGHIDHHFGNPALFHHFGRRLIIAVRIGRRADQIPGVVFFWHFEIFPQALIPVGIRSVWICQQIDSPPLLQTLTAQHIG